MRPREADFSENASPRPGATMHHARSRSLCHWWNVAALAAMLVMPHRGVAQGLPDRLDDRAFWSLLTTLSESGGTFRSENLLSNELGFQTVIPELLATTRPGGVYLGVGPEQNFTYIAAIRPRIAFIVDIRQQNQLYHLLYKALMEEAPTRAEFMALLFGRPRPAALSDTATVEQLFEAFEAIDPDSTWSAEVKRRVLRRLVVTHGFPLDSVAQATVALLLETVHAAGPDLTYSVSTAGGIAFGQGGRRSRMPTYGDLMRASDATGASRSYLASEALYRTVREMQRRNLIVPVVGNFGGETALQGIGMWLRARRAPVTTFYTSNVEQYLFQQPGVWEQFYRNVAALPMDSTSTFVRSLASGSTGQIVVVGRSGVLMLMSSLASMQEMVHAFEAGTLQGYGDVIRLSHPPRVGVAPRSPDSAATPARRPLRMPGKRVRAGRRRNAGRTSPCARLGARRDNSSTPPPAHRSAPA
jgi:hypothetical protein